MGEGLETLCIEFMQIHVQINNEITFKYKKLDQKICEIQLNPGVGCSGILIILRHYRSNA